MGFFVNKFFISIASVVFGLALVNQPAAQAYSGSDSKGQKQSGKSSGSIFGGSGYFGNVKVRDSRNGIKIVIRGNKASVERIELASDEFDEKRDDLIGDNLIFDRSQFGPEIDLGDFSSNGDDYAAPITLFKNKFVNDAMQQVTLLRKVIFRKGGVFERLVRRTQINDNLTVTEQITSDGDTTIRRLSETTKVGKNTTLTKQVTFKDDSIIKKLIKTTKLKTRKGVITVKKVLDKVVIRRGPNVPIST
jgi:hypothetical protein